MDDWPPRPHVMTVLTIVYVHVHVHVHVGTYKNLNVRNWAEFVPLNSQSKGEWFHKSSSAEEE